MENDLPVVETIGLTKVFKDFWRREKVRAVDDLNLQLHQGEVFGLLGPNGSGKSTTVKLLLGLLFPTKGRVLMFGRPPRDVEVKRRIGYLPEETYLYPYLNAEETLDFYGRIFELPRHERRKRIEALIRMVGLTGARKRRLGEYSKGMARRIGIAQALIGDPDLVLLDEPTTGLDPIGTDEIKKLVLELKDRGKTVLLCSHLLADVEDVCDRVAILYGGRIRALGRIDEFLAQKNVTQIQVRDLSPETLKEIERIIREREGDREIHVGHPRDRLENFFLQVIAKAHAESPTVSGAQFGDVSGQVYDEAISRTDTGKALIEKLTAPAEEEAAQPEAAPAAPEEAPRTPKKDVLERLEQAETPETPETPPEPAPPPKKAEEEDRGRQIIERLIHGDETEANDE